jgi:hypothetical protein
VPRQWELIPEKARVRASTKMMAVHEETLRKLAK